MKLKGGIIGLGYWGPNYIRNFSNHLQVEITWLCDISEKALKKNKKEYPNIRSTKNYFDLLQDPSLDFVAIATPPETHFPIARAFLEKGVHVFIAKPLTTSLSHAKTLAKIAKKKKTVLFTDLTYIYTKAVRFIQKYIEREKLGKPYYYDSIRSNLGLIQKDVNVIWDLTPHDLAILDFCFGFTPQKVFATASIHHNTKTEEMAHITITYTNNFVAHIHVSWLSPVKLRTISIGGSKKMIYFNDVEQDEKVKIYNKGVEITSSDITPFKPIYRSGDIFTPNIPIGEALAEEIKEFINLLAKKELSFENIERNLRIIQILEACDLSIRSGKPVFLKK